MTAIHITIRDMPDSLSLKETIRRKAEKLSQYFSKIHQCRIVLCMPQKHQHQGKLYSLRIELTAPGKEFAVSHKLNENIGIAIRDAFDALRRQLEDFAQKQRQRYRQRHARRINGFAMKNA